MELDLNFMESILVLYDELLKNGISLVYIGKFNHQVTKVFSTMYEEEMTRNSISKTTKRKVYHSIVEILQNMQKHTSQLSTEYRLGSGIFLLGHKDDVYYIITANKISEKNKTKLTQAIETVNNASPDELKRMYKEQLKGGKLSHKGGAGLGLIDIARKTGEKLDYFFIPIASGEQYFVLKVEIDSSKFN